MLRIPIVAFIVTPRVSNVRGLGRHCHDTIIRINLVEIGGFQPWKAL